jgi:flagellar biogenesis protein FliO
MTERDPSGGAPVYTDAAMTPIAAYVVQTLPGLVLLGLLGAAALLIARRAGLGHREGPLSLVGRLPLGGHRWIYLVRIGEVVHVLGASEAGITKLGEVDRAALPHAPSLERREARSLLDRLARRAGRASDSR